MLNNLKTIAQLISKEIDQINFNIFEIHNTLLSDVLNQIKLLSLSGKRIRAALLIMSYLAFFEDKDLNNIKDTAPEVIEFAILVELMHTYLLILDDVMDNGTDRRGIKTMHEFAKENIKNKYKNIRLSEDNLNHICNSIAISFGACLNHIANYFLFSNIKKDCVDKSIIDAYIFLNKILAETGYGQSLDMLFQIELSANQDDILKVCELKTAKYTFWMPIKIGLILAGIEENKISDSFFWYSYYAGIAFQIKDDLISIYGDKTKLGKSNSSDIKEGKRTLLLIKAIELASKEELKIILETVGNKNADLDSIENVKEIIEKTGAKKYSEDMCINFVAKAQEELNKIKHYFRNKESLDFFDGILDFIVNRDS